jgi:hypothetical protein
LHGHGIEGRRKRRVKKLIDTSYIEFVMMNIAKGVQEQNYNKTNKNIFKKSNIK